MTGAASNLIILADQADREQWLLARREGLGGSDMAAICGESRYRRAIDVWTDRMEPLPDASGPVNDDPDREDRLEMGHILEPVILGLAARGEWRDKAHRGIWRPPLVQRRDRPWHVGSADGLATTPVGGGWYEPGFNGRHPSGAAGMLTAPPDGGEWEEIEEVKTHGYHASLAYDERPGAEEPVPADKVIQCAWYSSLYGIPRVSLRALIDTHLRRRWRWVVDPALETELLTMAEDWWRAHITGGIRPSPDGSERYRSHLRKRFPADDGSIVRAAPDLDDVVAKLRAAKAATKAAEVEEERLAQLIQASMGSASVLETHLGRITWKVQAGRLKWRDALDETLRKLGWDSAQIRAFEETYRGSPPRVFLTPQTWSKK